MRETSGKTPEPAASPRPRVEVTLAMDTRTYLAVAARIDEIVREFGLRCRVVKVE